MAKLQAKKKKLWMKQQFSNQYTAVVATLTKNKKFSFIY